MSEKVIFKVFSFRLGDDCHFAHIHWAGARADGLRWGNVACGAGTASNHLGSPGRSGQSLEQFLPGGQPMIVPSSYGSWGPGLSPVSAIVPPVARVWVSRTPMWSVPVPVPVPVPVVPPGRRASCEKHCCLSRNS